MEPSSPEPGGDPASKSPLRVLVVDDHADSAASMQILIRRKHHEVETAFDGEEALRVGAALKPRLVFLDLSLPGKDGYEVAREIRATEWGKTAVLVAASGWAGEADRRRALERGFDHYLTKPIEPDTLYRLLDSIAQEESGPAPLTPA